MTKKVNSFIKRFSEGVSTEDTFQSGCCYWFSFILFFRFLDKGTEIMYDEVANHFGCMIDGRIYDITGDVTDSYDWEPWSELSDEALRARIIRDCVKFEEEDM